MTPKQTRLYWNLWRTAVKAQQWDHLPLAEQTSLRHLAHKSACGKLVSSKDATNAQLDRIFSEFRRLAGGNLVDGLQLTCGTQEHDFRRDDKLSDPGSEKRIKWVILNRILPDMIHYVESPVDYAEAIMRARFNTTDMDHLDPRQLWELLYTLQARLAALKKSVEEGTRPQPNHEAEPATNPF